MTPNQPTLSRIQDLETEFARAMTHLYAVGNGLAAIRQDLAAQVTMTAPPLAGPALTLPTTSPSEPAPTPSLPAAAAPPRPRWWERPGAVAKVLGAVGAVVTLVGVALLLAIAIAAGLFGPVPRTVAGALLAGALLVAGTQVRRRSPARRPGSVSGGEALAATGLAAAYLDLLATTAIYDFVPSDIGLVLAAVLATGGFVLARRWDSQLLAVLAATPAIVLAPAVAGMSLPMASFVAILLVGSALAHLGRPWRWLYAARTVPAILTLVVFALTWSGGRTPLLIVCVVTAIAMVAAGVTEHSARLTRLPLYAALASAVPLTVVVLRLPDGRLPLAAALAVLFLAVAALVRSLTGRVFASRELWVAPLVIGTVLVVLAALDLPTISQSGLALTVASGAYLIVAAWLRSRPVAAMAGLSAAFAGALFLPAFGATVAASIVMGTLDPLPLLHGLGLTALAGLGYITAVSLRDDPRGAALPAGLWALATGSATVVLTATWLGSLVDELRLGFYGGHAAVTALWTALAALLMTTLARRSGDRGLLVRLGLGLLALAVTKVFLFDLAALGGLFRVFAFIVTGVIVLVIGVLFARPDAGESSTTTGPEPAPGALEPQSQEVMSHSRV